MSKWTEKYGQEENRYLDAVSMSIICRISFHLLYNIIEFIAELFTLMAFVW